MTARDFFPLSGPTPYAAAAARLGKREQVCLPGRATVLYRVGPDDIAVRYHSTDVVTYSADGSTTIRTRGHQTVTTKDRIKTYAPTITVWQSDYTWYLAPSYRAGGDFDARAHLTVPFKDGIRVWPDGVIQLPGEERLVAVARHAAPPPPPAPPPARVRRRAVLVNQTSLAGVA